MWRKGFGSERMVEEYLRFYQLLLEENEYVNKPYSPDLGWWIWIYY